MPQVEIDRYRDIDSQIERQIDRQLYDYVCMVNGDV